MDLSFEKKKPTLKELHAMYVKKTGCLISAAAQIGAIIGGGNEEEIEIAINYALNVGLAFQIIDDILDYQDGKIEINSFISFMSVDEAKEYASKLTRSGIESIREYDDGSLTELAHYLTVRNY